MRIPLASRRQRVRAGGSRVDAALNERDFGGFGAGAVIVPPAEIVGAERIDVGDDVLVLEHAALVVEPGGELVLNSRVRLARGVRIHCTTRIELHEAVSSSDHVAIVDTWARTPKGAASPSSDGPISIGRGAYLGFGSFIGPGVTVGAGAYVGEGAVVLADVADHTVVVGNPARAVRRWDRDRDLWVELDD